jgi:hypothetical protein
VVKWCRPPQQFARTADRSSPRPMSSLARPQKPTPQAGKLTR